MFRESELPQVYDSDGRPRESGFRKGKGPGELTWPYDLVSLANDSLLIFDASERHAVLLTADLRYVRTIRMPFELVNPVRDRSSSMLLATGAYATTMSAGYPLHRVTLDGPLRVTSFGPGDGELRTSASNRQQHVLSIPQQNGFWSASMYGYDLYEWTLDGRQKQLLSRRPSWFRSASSGDLGSRTRRPSPLVAGLSLDSSGYLWTFVRVPSRRWRAAWQRSLTDGEVTRRSMALDKLWDTMIEVIDPRKKRVIARRLFKNSESAYLVSVLTGPRIALYESAPNGTEATDVLRLRLKEVF